APVGAPTQQSQLNVAESSSAVTFGTFALNASPDIAATQLVPIAAALKKAVTGPLGERPVNFEALAGATAEALQQLLNGWWISSQTTLAEEAWAAGRYELYLQSVRRAESMGGPAPDTERLALARSRMREPLKLDADNEADRIRKAADLVNETSRALN